MRDWWRHVPLGDFEFFLHFFERDALSFRVEEEHHEELHHHHGGKKRERVAAGGRRHQREGPGNQRVHDPVGETAEALAFGAHAIRKHFAEIDPDHRALRKREEGDETNQHPHQQFLVAVGEKDSRDAGETKASANRADEQ